MPVNLEIIFTRRHQPLHRVPTDTLSHYVSSYDSKREVTTLGSNERLLCSVA